jgi:hypothetical protein
MGFGRGGSCLEIRPLGLGSSLLEGSGISRCNDVQKRDGVPTYISNLVSGLSDPYFLSA